MRLTINGEEKDFPEALTLSGLIAHIGLAPERVAVELNRAIVARELWATIALKDNDRLEIVHFVGGGRSPASRSSHRLLFRYMRANLSA